MELLEILKMQDRTFHAIYNLISLYTYVCMYVSCVCVIGYLWIIAWHMCLRIIWKNPLNLH